jgi:hypothetical protein
MTDMVKRAVGKAMRVLGLRGDGDREVEPALVTTCPSPQNALDTFAGEWISAAPPSLPGLTAGKMPLFADPRVAWALDRLGGVRDQRVLELGPLEAGHSYMLQERGAREVIAVEGNRRCFLKCLVMKEVAGLHAVRFLLGNFVEYLRETSERFDLCLASGVLYHMAQPVELLHLIARASDRVYIWTHYYDERKARASASGPHFSGAHEIAHGTFSCTAQRYEYYTGSRAARYAGGLAAHSHWLSREDLLRCLAHVGFTKIDVAFEEPDHVHGPCLALAASRE